LSLSVLEPGEVAVTAGTSGVVYGVTDKKNFDPKSRVNIFVHVNHSEKKPRYGVLLCVNGTGILNSWLKQNFAADGMDYPQMNELAAQAPVGSDGLTILPYGNGAERTLENQDIGASIHGWNFNIHKKTHFLRAAQEDRLRPQLWPADHARHGHEAQDRQGRQRQHVPQPAVRRGLCDDQRRDGALQHRRLPRRRAAGIGAGI
jgi:hypothetical protein